MGDSVTPLLATLAVGRVAVARRIGNHRANHELRAVAILSALRKRISRMVAACARSLRSSALKVEAKLLRNSRTQRTAWASARSVANARERIGNATRQEKSRVEVHRASNASSES